MLKTLAVGYAEAGRFQEAAGRIREASVQAPPAEQPELERLLKLFGSGQKEVPVRPSAATADALHGRADMQ